MKLGVPKEIKNSEYRVGMTPESVAEAVHNGHEVMVEAGAGMGIGATDAEYNHAGAIISANPAAIFTHAEMIIKVKEPLAAERTRLRRGQILFTYLHLAADKALTRELMNSGAVCIAYETITDATGHLPLLAPMSKIAGRLAVGEAAHYLQRSAGGLGKLIGGVPGVEAAKVLVLGGGIVGRNATRIALGMGARVTVLDKSAKVMDAIIAEFNGNAQTAYSSPSNLARLVANADVVIGGVLLPGETAPKIVSETMIKSMRPGSVVVDVAIDQGGCIATAKPTTHDNPVYVKHGVVHYCVSNMPGAVPHTSTHALNNVTLPFILTLANNGWKNAMQENLHLKNGLSIVEGALTCAHSAASLHMKHTDVDTFF